MEVVVGFYNLMEGLILGIKKIMKVKKLLLASFDLKTLLPHYTHYAPIKKLFEIEIKALALYAQYGKHFCAKQKPSCIRIG